MVAGALQKERDGAACGALGRAASMRLCAVAHGAGRWPGNVRVKSVLGSCRGVELPSCALVALKYVSDLVGSFV